METLNIICDSDENDSKKPENKEKKEEEPKEIIIEKKDNIIEELKGEEKKEEEPKEIIIEQENNIVEESFEEEKIEEEPKEKEIQVTEIKEEKDNVENEDLMEKYFVIIYSTEEKEEPKDMTFSKDSKIKPKVILVKEIKYFYCECFIKVLYIQINKMIIIKNKNEYIKVFVLICIFPQTIIISLFWAQKIKLELFL